MKTSLEKERVDDFIANFFAKKMDASELKELHNWIEESDENEAYFMQAKEIWFSAIGISDQPSFDDKEAFRDFLVRVEVEKKKRFHFYYTLRRVAAAVLLIGFTCGAYWFGRNSFRPELANVSVEAPLGSKTKLYLPDGTLVWLNAGSSIEYDQTYGIDNRKVAFRGEGYFEVTKNKHIPFQIETPELTVKVLGTKFNFKNYQDDHEACVTLLEGMVRVGSNNANNVNYCLKPNQQAVYDKNSKKMAISSVEAKSASTWTQGFLFFNEEKLSDIVKELERSYNVNITISDSQLRDFRFYGKFIKADQNVEMVLEDLSLTGKFKYKIKGKDVVLSQK